MKDGTTRNRATRVFLPVEDIKLEVCAEYARSFALSAAEVSALAPELSGSRNPVAQRHVLRRTSSHAGTRALWVQVPLAGRQGHPS